MARIKNIPYVYAKLLKQFDEEKITINEFKKKIVSLRISTKEWDKIVKDLKKMGLVKKNGFKSLELKVNPRLIDIELKAFISVVGSFLITLLSGLCLLLLLIL